MPLRYEIWKVLKLLNDDRTLKFKAQNNSGYEYIIQVDNSNELIFTVNNRSINKIESNLLWQLI